MDKHFIDVRVCRKSCAQQWMDEMRVDSCGDAICT